MKLYTINTGFFKLDGGAMFGVVPKSIWNKLNEADSNNMCTWAMRCLLIETSDRLVLIDTGIGDKQDEKFFSHYFLHGNDTLEKSINKCGFEMSDITDVILTHLHFDHCGGAVRKDKTGKLFSTFKNAIYWSQKNQWESAINPNDREKASFLKENFLPLQENNQLHFLESGTEIFDGFKFFLSKGHTDSMIIPLIQYNDSTIAYMADLIPSCAHISIPYIMSYDVMPLETMIEKKSFLMQAYQHNYTLFFEHDPIVECAKLTLSEKGIKVKETFNLEEI
jgi:glyoxylase-like metal-dependent hydrolase (beta-lactamase superfamily II)